MDRTADGGIVGQWKGTTSLNQHWQIVDAGSGYVKIMNRLTGKCIDNGGTDTEAAPIKMYSNSTSFSQQWLMTPVN